MLEDQTFILESELRRILNFSAKSDPFLLMPTAEPEMELNKQLVARIQFAERIMVMELQNSDRELSLQQALEAFVSLKHVESVKLTLKPKRQFRMRKNDTKSKIERSDKTPPRNPSQEKSQYFQYGRQVIFQRSEVPEFQKFEILEEEP